jgi:hypothetical protein
VIDICSLPTAALVDASVRLSTAGEAAAEAGFSSDDTDDRADARLGFATVVAALLDKVSG